LLLLEYVEALLNIPQSHFNGVSFLNREILYLGNQNYELHFFIYNFYHQDVNVRAKVKLLLHSFIMGSY